MEFDDLPDTLERRLADGRAVALKATAKGTRVAQAWPGSFAPIVAVSADHAATEGQRKVVGVMHRDSVHYASAGCAIEYDGRCRPPRQRPSSEARIHGHRDRAT